MVRHIVCVLDRTVGHVSICWDYVSTFLCNKKRACLRPPHWSSELVPPGAGKSLTGKGPLNEQIYRTTFYQDSSGQSGQTGILELCWTWQSSWVICERSFSS